MPELTSAPNLAPLYLKAAVTGLTRRGGELPSTEYLRHDITVDREHLAEYARVCGSGIRDELPITYPHVLSFPASMRLMTDSDFPFPLVGLVHVANTIHQRRPLLADERLSQRVYATRLRPHRKGTQFDVVTETSAAGEVVWWEISTYLRRGRPQEEAVPETTGTAQPGDPVARWRVPADIGRRYAAVSGDRNPIHLHALTAKAFGFPRAIAHGMWSQARCLAALADRAPGACTVEVAFQKPVLLPAHVEFALRGHDAGWDFALLGKGGKTHLTGTLRS